MGFFTVIDSRQLISGNCILLKLSKSDHSLWKIHCRGGICAGGHVTNRVQKLHWHCGLKRVTLVNVGLWRRGVGDVSYWGVFEKLNFVVNWPFQCAEWEKELVVPMYMNFFLAIWSWDWFDFPLDFCVLHYEFRLLNSGLICVLYSCDCSTIVKEQRQQQRQSLNVERNLVNRMLLDTIECDSMLLNICGNRMWNLDCKFAH